jgi:hypothetical protein
MRNFAVSAGFLVVAGLLNGVVAMTLAHAQATIRMTEADCSRLTAHVPAADVAYQPGVDVNGNAVAPADLNGGTQIAVPDVIAIPVTIDLATTLGINTNFLARPTVGTVEVTSDGRVSYNGQPVGGHAQQELARLCQQR